MQRVHTGCKFDFGQMLHMFDHTSYGTNSSNLHDVTSSHRKLIHDN